VKNLKCKHCGTQTNKAGKPFAHRGALNIHESVHCPEKPLLLKQGKEKPGCCEDPDIRLLSSGDPREAFVMSKGYKKVCDNCEEVFA
jgi:hypothetical protein